MMAPGEEGRALLSVKPNIKKEVTLPMPPGRKPISARRVNEKKREKKNRFIHKGKPDRVLELHSCCRNRGGEMRGENSIRADEKNSLEGKCVHTAKGRIENVVVFEGGGEGA